MTVEHFIPIPFAVNLIAAHDICLKNVKNLTGDQISTFMSLPVVLTFAS